MERMSEMPIRVLSSASTTRANDKRLSLCQSSSKQPIEERCVHIVKVNADARRNLLLRDILYEENLGVIEASDAFLVQDTEYNPPLWAPLRH